MYVLIGARKDLHLVMRDEPEWRAATLMKVA
jgi:hypothetical protein